MAVPGWAMVSRLRSPTFQEHADDVAFEANGATVVTAGGASIHRWNAADGVRTTSASYESGAPAAVLDLSADGTTVAIGYQWITVHGAGDGRLIKNIGSTGTLGGIAISGDGRWTLARGSGSVGNYIYDVTGTVPRRTVEESPVGARDRARPGRQRRGRGGRHPARPPRHHPPAPLVR